MTLEAQSMLGAQPEMTAEARQFMDWALDNPMTSDPLMVAFASTDEAIAANIVVENGAITTSAVTDEAIKSVVNRRWDLVAGRRFAA